MSFNVLIIPEDFRLDQHILAPLIKRMCAEAGWPRARVEVCTDPVLGGVSQALDWDRLLPILDMFPMVNTFLLIVDRDGLPGRRDALDRLEQNARRHLVPSRILLGENAWQEIEGWGLAGQELPRSWRWKEVRAELHPKEVYFEPLVQQRKLTHEPGAGRKTLGREAALNYSRVRSRCPEDIQHLENRLRALRLDCTGPAN